MKILIVDDSETVRVQLKKDLESQGYTVIEGVDGIDGLAKLSENPDVKLIITDVNMPKMDGLAMSKKIRDNGGTALPIIIVMTTEMDQTLKAKGKEAGVVAWVTKPYVADKLLQAVAKLAK